MNAIAKRAARAVLSSLPFDPGAMWRELSDEQREGFRALLELTSGARELAPPDPPAELRELLDAAADEFRVPRVLLVAIAWERTRYQGDRFMALDVAPSEQARAVAYLVRRLSTERGLAGGLVRFCGDRAAAARIAGTTALLTAARVDAGGYDSVRQVLELIEG